MPYSNLPRHNSHPLPLKRVVAQSFPKRFFFAFVKRLLRSERLENLVVTYALPLSYHPGALAEDHGSLAPLPLFRDSRLPDEKAEVAIIGVGYMPLGLAAFLDKHKQDVAVKILFPVPMNAENFRRNWAFINTLRRDFPKAVQNPIRVDGSDVSDVFDHIASLTNRGQIRSEFGPFGPKPLSLAMCLFANLSRSVVRYTQPRVYHPHYTDGIGMRNGEPAINSYCLRLDNADLYSL